MTSAHSDGKKRVVYPYALCALLSLIPHLSTVALLSSCQVSQNLYGIQRPSSLFLQEFWVPLSHLPTARIANLDGFVCLFSGVPEINGLRYILDYRASTLYTPLKRVGRKNSQWHDDAQIQQETLGPFGALTNIPAPVHHQSCLPRGMRATGKWFGLPRGG